MNKTSRSTIALLIFFGFLSSCTSEQNTENNASLEQKADSTHLLGSGFGISHVSLIVNDLENARKYYRDELGFNMSLTDKSKKGIIDGTNTSSASFPDMSSLQLLSVKDTALVSQKHAFLTSFMQSNEGVGLYSISTSSATNTHNWLNANGFKMDDIRSGRSTEESPMGWDEDSGGPEWHNVAFSSKNPPAYLPNYLEYVDFPYEEIEFNWKYLSSRRKNDKYNHPNGVVEIAALRIAVNNVTTALEAFKKMGFIELGINESQSVARLKIAHNQELQLIAPQYPDDGLADFLTKREAGVYAIAFKVKNIDETHEFFKKKLPATSMRIESSPKRLIISKDYAKGVQLEFIEESKEQAALAQIYSFKKGTKLDSTSLRYVSALYVKNCGNCHGPNREGSRALFAPSLRSRSLLTTLDSDYFKHMVSYGRQGTGMAGYARKLGGSLAEEDMDLLLQWLYELGGVEEPVELSTAPVIGDVALGKTLYDENCASCHGSKGEGVTAPALGNPMLIATASDAFIRYAIAEGRDNTLMTSFKETLSNVEIDALTAFLRSRASGWDSPVTEPKPPTKSYVRFPQNQAAKLTLHEELYVSPKQLLQSLRDSSRIVILDARSKSAWHQAHIPGAISIPYDEEPDTFMKNLPNDGTWIVTYYARPEEESKRVVNTLKRLGYEKVAILDKGLFDWIKHGYPIE